MRRLMKKFLLLFFTFCTITAFSQITVLKQDIIFDVPADPPAYSEFKVEIPMVNDSTEQFLFWWEIERGNSPDEWEYKLCDINLCYFWGFEACPCSEHNTFNPGDTANMMLYCDPNGIEGTAVVNLRICADCDPDRKCTSYVDIPVTINSGTVSTKEEDFAENVVLYPNPASDMFKIKNDETISDVVVYNIVGKKLISESHKPGKSHDISRLTKGIYLVRLLDKSNNIVKVLRMTKE